MIIEEIIISKPEKPPATGPFTGKESHPPVSNGNIEIPIKETGIHHNAKRTHEVKTSSFNLNDHNASGRSEANGIKE